MIAATALSLNALFAYAALRSSANYQIKTDVVDQGGTKSSSTYYKLNPDASGQSAVIGKSISANYIGWQGYIYGFGLEELIPPTVPGSLSAEARPGSSPTYVYLTWQASTDESGVKGYNLYRSNTPGSGYLKIMSLISGTTTNDTSVVFGTNYYYVVRAQDTYNNESGNSNQASAPLLNMTREAMVVSPISGGYMGGTQDAVPGSTINYNIYQKNIGFAVATSVEVTDRIPNNTNFLLGSATGEGVTQVKYSNNSGATYDYTPAGSYIDPAVTNIKILCNDIYSNGSRKVWYWVVIR